MIFVLIGKVNKIEPNLYHDRDIIIQQQVHIFFFYVKDLAFRWFGIAFAVELGVRRGKVYVKIV